MNRMLFSVVLFCIAGVVCAAPWLPPNDSVETPEELPAGSEVRFVPKGLAWSSEEVFTPVHFAAFLNMNSFERGSLWYRWRPTMAGPVVWDTEPEVYTIKVDVLTGSSAATLKPLAGPVVAGEECWVRVSAASQYLGKHQCPEPVITLRIAPPRPPNHSFATRQVLDSSRPLVWAEALAALPSRGEGDYYVDEDDALAASAWYEWRAPRAGDFDFMTRFNRAYLFHINEDSGEPSGERLVPTPANGTMYSLQEGERVAVQLFHSGRGAAHRLRVVIQQSNPWVVPPNITSETAIPIETLPFEVAENSLSGFGGADRSLWWRWQVPASGIYRIRQREAPWNSHPLNGPVYQRERWSARLLRPGRFSSFIDEIIYPQQDLASGDGVWLWEALPEDVGTTVYLAIRLNSRGPVWFSLEKVEEAPNARPEGAEVLPGEFPLTARVNLGFFHSRRYFGNGITPSRYFLWTAPRTALARVEAPPFVRVSVARPDAPEEIVGDIARGFAVEAGTAYLFIANARNASDVCEAGWADFRVVEGVPFSRSDPQVIELGSALPMQVSLIDVEAIESRKRHGLDAPLPPAPPVLWLRWTAPRDTGLVLQNASSLPGWYDFNDLVVRLVDEATGQDISFFTEAQRRDSPSNAPPVCEVKAGQTVRIGLVAPPDADADADAVLYEKVRIVLSGETLCPYDDQHTPLEIEDGGRLSTVGATAAPGEPAHDGQPARHSVWCRWRATWSGWTSLRAGDANGGYSDGVGMILPRIGLYQRAADGRLHAVPGAWWREQVGRVRFDAVYGAEYLIAVDGPPTRAGVSLYPDEGPPTLYQRWISRFPELTGESILATADAAGDGVSNLWKMLCDVDPRPGADQNAAERRHLPRLVVHSDWLELRYRIPDPTLRPSFTTPKHGGQLCEDGLGLAWTPVYADELQDGWFSIQIPIQPGKQNATLLRAWATAP